MWLLPETFSRSPPTPSSSPAVTPGGLSLALPLLDHSKKYTPGVLSLPFPLPGTLCPQTDPGLEAPRHWRLCPQLPYRENPVEPTSSPAKAASAVSLIGLLTARLTTCLFSSSACTGSPFGTPSLAYQL